MKAIIMAGGEGSRLRPLTCDCPKPMLPVMNRPMMEYAVETCKKYGITEIGATLGYLPRHITDYFGDGHAFGVCMRWYIEKTPLGTAGSVKQAQDFLDERFVVLSGDGITDIDLNSAIEFHESRHALATLILKRNDHPQEYGMVVTDADSRIRSFHEKPGRSDIWSDRINTGIYILEKEVLSRIPPDCFYDFAQDLFPQLLRENAPVYGYTADGYWCDVGDIGAYLQVHVDAMDGKIRGLDFPEKTCIAAGAEIDDGAVIGEYTVIGENCRIEAGANIKRSVLFPGAEIRSGAQLRGCVAGSGCMIGSNTQMYEESAVGSGARTGEGCILDPGVKLWPGKELSAGQRPEANIVWGHRQDNRFTHGSIAPETPAQAARAVQACIAEMKPREVLIGRTASTVADAMWHAAVSGAMAQGVRAIDAGVCTLPQLRCVQQSLHAEAALLTAENRITILNAVGAYLTEKGCRMVLKAWERQDFQKPFHGITHALQTACQNELGYIASLAAVFRADPAAAPKIVVFADDDHLLHIAESAMLRAGLNVRGEWNCDDLTVDADEIGIILSDDGTKAKWISGEFRMDEPLRQLSIVWTALESGEPRILLPAWATRAADALAAQYGSHAAFLPGDTAAWMNAVCEKYPLQAQLQFDGLYAAMAFLSLLTDRGLTLTQWTRLLPQVCRMNRKIAIPAETGGYLLSGIAESIPCAEPGGGVRIAGDDDSWAWLCPDEVLPEMQLFAEASNMEAARELCDFCEGEIARLLKQKKESGS